MKQEVEKNTGTGFSGISSVINTLSFFYKEHMHTSIILHTHFCFLNVVSRDTLNVGKYQLKIKYSST